jgi:hypothetical protein
MLPWHRLVCVCPDPSIYSDGGKNSLPHRVNAAISLLEQHAALEEDKKSSIVTPSDTSPEWVNMLPNGEDREASDAQLESYMREQGLRGVVLIKENEVSE